MTPSAIYTKNETTRPDLYHHSDIAMSRFPTIYIVLTDEVSATGGNCRGVALAGAYISATTAEAKKEEITRIHTSDGGVEDIDPIGYAGLQGYRIKHTSGSTFAVWVDVVVVEDALPGFIGSESEGALG